VLDVLVGIVRICGTFPNGLPDFHAGFSRRVAVTGVYKVGEAGVCIVPAPFLGIAAVRFRSSEWDVK
jgi:hypothetical protein